MKFRTMALALAVAATGLAGGQAFAQDRDVTVVHSGPTVHRTVRVDRPDGSTVIRRTTRWTHHEMVRPHRVVVIHRRHEPMRRVVVIHHRHVPMRHVVVRSVHHRPAYVVNRHVTVIHNAG